jgi:hypothetical protein
MRAQFEKSFEDGNDVESNKSSSEACTTNEEMKVFKPSMEDEPKEEKKKETLLDEAERWIAEILEAGEKKRENSDDDDDCFNLCSLFQVLEEANVAIRWRFRDWRWENRKRSKQQRPKRNRDLFSEFSLEERAPIRMWELSNDR